MRRRIQRVSQPRSSGGAAAFSGARVFDSGTQGVTGPGTTVLTFDSERYDTDAYHDTGSNTSRLTAPSTAKYGIGFNLSLGNGAMSTFNWFVELLLNGTTVIGALKQWIVSDPMIVSLHVEYALSAGDYVEIRVSHDNGMLTENVNAAANYSPEFWMSKR